MNVGLCLLMAMFFVAMLVMYHQSSSGPGIGGGHGH